MPKITVIGLGPWEKGYVTECAAQLMKDTFTIFRTGKHPAARAYRGVRGSVALDGLYDSSEDFAELNRRAADEVMSLAAQHGAVAYAVPGQGMAGDSTVVELLVRAASTHEVAFLPGVDESAPFAAMCAVRTGRGNEIYAVVPAALLDARHIDRSAPLVVTQLDSRLTAGQAKLALAPLYGDEAPAILGIRGELLDIALKDLDRQNGYGLRTMLWLPAPAPGAARYDLGGIVSIMDRLRGPGGCPWDREQTHESLKQYLLEETYETIEAIDRGNMEELCEELGDVLLQVLFHARIASERGDFDIIDVADGISRKMILRHPHIFDGAKADTPEQVVANWDAIKKLEKGQDTETGMMRRIPQALPAVLRSMKVQGKAARVGFDWNDVWGAFEKLEEEIAELREAIEQDLGEGKLAEEFGDVLFAAVNVARFIGVHPEFALKGTVEKFIRRFAHVERRAAETGKSLESMTLDEMDAFWNEAKDKEALELT